jgi:short-subunit dehydrogenase
MIDGQNSSYSNADNFLPLYTMHRQKLRADKVVVITGASSGIGAQFALQLAEAGTRIYLIGRDLNRLEQVANEAAQKGASAICLTCDMSKQVQVESLVQTLNRAETHIDILINNAGLSQRGFVAETSLEVDRYLMEVNYFSAITLTKGLLTMLYKSKHPRIIVLSSLSGKFGFFQRSAYSASKHALHGFFESLQVEDYSKGLRITIACPGRVQTPISMNALRGDGTPHNQMDQGQEKGIPVETCVRRILSASSKGQFQIIIAQNETLLYRLKSFSHQLFFKLAQKVKDK